MFETQPYDLALGLRLWGLGKIFFTFLGLSFLIFKTGVTTSLPVL